MAGIGWLEIIILAFFAIVFIGILVARARRNREAQSPPEDDAGW